MSQKKAQILNPLSGNINVAGVITASSFVGSGEGLTGVASTDNIQPATEATFLSGVKITGVTTASGGVVGNLTGNVTGNATGLSGTPNITVGAVNASSGTISGNLSVGGTLTYQDVTNIDSIGIITAQQGIQVLANGLDVTGFSTFKTGVSVTGVVTATSFSGNVTGNLTGDVNAATFDTGVGGVVVTGVATATSFTGDGSNLTGTNRTASLVASGTLSNGQTVIVTSDGKVAGISTSGESQIIGSESVFESASTSDVVAQYDSNLQKVVIAYYDGGNSNYGTAVVGTVSGTSISFGSPVVFNEASTSYNSIAFDSTNNKVIIGFRDSNGYGTAIVGTVSGTSISFGSKNSWNSTSTFWISLAYDTNAEKVAIFYRDSGGGKAIIGTVSGTSISYGSAVSYTSNTADYNAAVYDSTNQKVVVAYEDDDNNDYATAIVGTVSGTSISFGSAVVFSSNTTDLFSGTYDSDTGKVIFTGRENVSGSGYRGFAIVGTISGTSISFGTAVPYTGFSGSGPQQQDVVYDSSAKRVVVFYQDANDSYKGKFVVGKVDGDNNTITFGSTFIVNDGETWPGHNGAATYDSNAQRVVFSYRDSGNSNYGTAIVVKTGYVDTNLASENFIGFSDAAYTNGQTAKIQVVTAIDDAQSGLTTGSKHYVQNDGTLSTTAGSPSVLAGTAISDTEIIVKQ